VLLSDVPDDHGERFVTGIEEFDRVLGGGLVPGSLVLVGGDPGIGKSTLVLQAAARLAMAGAAVAYVCGEESPRQVRLRAARLGLEHAPITLIPETNLEAALAAAEGCGAALTVVDSIQAVYVDGLETRTGGPAQLAEAGARLVGWAKSTGTATVVTGHVTKAGEIAGPRLLEHLVDAVLYFEGAEGGAWRVLRAVKNRFGATDEVGVFEMTGEGLRSVEEPSAVFLDEAGRTASGCAVTAVMEGTRALAVEVQALAVPSYLASPRRIASGLETARLHLMLAVLARRAGLNASNMDVVATVSGGMRLRDAGADLAVAAALVSAIRDEPLPAGTAFLGEVALSGTVRPVPNIQRRLAELARVGFERCVVPQGAVAVPGIAVHPVRTLREAMKLLTGAPAEAPRAADVSRAELHPADR
jgi:DNA repair protein RadA/Sms